MAMFTTGNRPDRGRRASGEEPVEVFELTCGVTGRTHLAPVTGVEEAITAERGWFPALCGERIAASSLASPPGQPCLPCRQSGQSWRHVGRRGEQP